MRTVDARRWGDYNHAQSTRPVRPLAEAAAALAGPAADRTAVELGCGIGREATYLAGLGWRVHTYDADASMTDHLVRLGAILPITHTHTRIQDVAAFPACELLLACASLPFVPSNSFGDVWQRCVDALRPGGVLAVDLFGDNDDWSAGPGSFLTRAQVDDLVSDLEVEQLVEWEYDGNAFSGPKHWHTFRVIARRP